MPILLRKEEAIAATDLLNSDRALTLGDLIRDPSSLNSSLSCVPLMIERKGECVMLPTNAEQVQCADEIVFCGTERSESLLMATLNNPYTLHYLVTGTDLPRGYFFGWLANRFKQDCKQWGQRGAQYLIAYLLEYKRLSTPKFRLARWTARY